MKTRHEVKKSGIKDNRTEYAVLFNLFVYQILE